MEEKSRIIDKTWFKLLTIVLVIMGVINTYVKLTDTFEDAVYGISKMIMKKDSGKLVLQNVRGDTFDILANDYIDAKIVLGVKENDQINSIKSSDFQHVDYIRLVDTSVSLFGECNLYNDWDTIDKVMTEHDFEKGYWLNQNTMWYRLYDGKNTIIVVMKITDDWSNELRVSVFRNESIEDIADLYEVGIDGVYNE